MSRFGVRGVEHPGRVDAEAYLGFVDNQPRKGLMIICSKTGIQGHVSIAGLSVVGAPERGGRSVERAPGALQ